nr:hypothetical protein [Tanacetum cinerariifolium]
KKEIFYAGFFDNNNVADLIDTNGWKWLAMWKEKYRFLNNIHIPQLTNNPDTPFWISNDGKEGKFSTNRMWKDVRRMNNKVEWNDIYVMLLEVQMAMIAISLERVLEGQNELLVNLLTLTFSSVNHYTSKALRELPELALLCGRMFPKEFDKIKKYIRGLLDMIHGSVVASKPKTMQEAVAIATELMDQKIRTFAERKITSKRKFENTSRSTQNQQQHPNKRQNTGRVYTAASGKKKQYGGSKPLCAKCNYHHDGPCAPKCHKCNKVGHFARDCRSTTNTNNANNQRGTGSGQKPTCYECGVQGYFKRECPKLRNNNNHGNQGRRNNAPAKVYVVGHAGTYPDANVVT